MFTPSLIGVMADKIVFLRGLYATIFYMKNKKVYVVGNWKLNPISLKNAKELFSEVKKTAVKVKEVNVVVIPPYLYIPEFSRFVKDEGIKLGAQNIFFEEVGPFTGEVSASVLSNFAVSYVIVGHSERRARGETDEEVNKKVKATLKKRLIPIVCVGEKERDSEGGFFTGIENQIKALTSGLESKDLAKIIIAYEPIWAIGTGKTATVSDVEEMQIFIFSVLTKLFDRKVAEKIPLLYGGSVNAGNAKILHKEGGMNGFLVGGASLKASEFTKIINATLSQEK